MIQQIRKDKDIILYAVGLKIEDQRIIIKERIDHWKSYCDEMKFWVKNIFGRSLAKANWIFDYLIELYLIKMGN